MKERAVIARRWSRRFGPLLAILATALLLSTQGAFAARAWCSADPVISVNGINFDLWITGQPPHDGKPIRPTGKIQLIVHVPQGSAYKVVSLDEGFGYGYNLSFVEESSLKVTAKGIDLSADVYASTSDSMPIRANIAPRTNSGLIGGSAVWGTSDSWFSVVSCKNC
jgi:hypothetical protein